MAYTSDLTFVVGVDNSPAIAGLRQLQKIISSGNIGRGTEFALGRITGKANEFQKSLDASSARVIAFGATAGVLNNMSAAFKRLVSSAIEVNQAVTEINTLLNLSSQDLTKFTSELFQVANDTGQSFQDAAKTAQEFSRQGLTVEQTLQRTKAALTLTRLSGLDLDNSIAALTATLNSFRNEALSDIEIVNRLANVDAKFAVSSADLAEGLKRVGGAASDAGVQFNQVIALITAAQQATARGGSVIGNSFKTIFTRLQRPAVLDDLEQMGIAVRKTNGENLNLIDILKNLSGAYDTLSSAQKSFVSETVGGVYQINILKSILGDLGHGASVYEQALEAAANSTAAAEERSRQLNQTLSSQLQRTVNDITKGFASLSHITIEPTIRGGLTGVDNIVKLLGNLFSEEQSSSIGVNIGRAIVGGIGKSFSNLLSGPGIQFAVFGIIKLFQKLANFIQDSVKDLTGINHEEKERAAIEQLVASHLLKQKDLVNQLRSGTTDLNTIQTEITGEVQQQLFFLKEIAALIPILSKGLQATGQLRTTLNPLAVASLTASDGYIPNLNIARKERTGAAQGGYTAGSVVGSKVSDGSKTVPIVANTAETKSSVSVGGKVFEWINPPKNSPAGRRHANTSKSKTGIDPYELGQQSLMCSIGFVPNLSTGKVPADKIIKAGMMRLEMEGPGMGQAFRNQWEDRPRNLEYNEGDLKKALTGVLKGKPFKGKYINPLNPNGNLNKEGDDIAKSIAGYLGYKTQNERRDATDFPVEDIQKMLNLRGPEFVALGGFEDFPTKKPVKGAGNASYQGEKVVIQGKQLVVPYRYSGLKNPNKAYGAFSKGVRQGFQSASNELLGEDVSGTSELTGEATVFGNFLDYSLGNFFKSRGVRVGEKTGENLDVYSYNKEAVEQFFHATAPFAGADIKGSLTGDTPGSMGKKIARILAFQRGAGEVEVPSFQNVKPFTGKGKVGVISPDFIYDSKAREIISYAALATGKPVKTQIGPFGAGKTKKALEEGAQPIIGYADVPRFDEYIINSDAKKNISSGVMGIALASSATIIGLKRSKGQVISNLRERMANPHELDQVTGKEIETKIRNIESFDDISDYDKVFEEISKKASSRFSYGAQGFVPNLTTKYSLGYDKFRPNILGLKDIFKNPKKTISQLPFRVAGAIGAYGMGLYTEKVEKEKYPAQQFYSASRYLLGLGGVRKLEVDKRDRHAIGGYAAGMVNNEGEHHAGHVHESPVDNGLANTIGSYRLAKNKRGYSIQDAFDFDNSVYDARINTSGEEESKSFIHQVQGLSSSTKERIKKVLSVFPQDKRRNHENYSKIGPLSVNPGISYKDSPLEIIGDDLDFAEYGSPFLTRINFKAGGFVPNLANRYEKELRKSLTTKERYSESQAENILKEERATKKKRGQYNRDYQYLVNQRAPNELSMESYYPVKFKDRGTGDIQLVNNKGVSEDNKIYFDPSTKAVKIGFLDNDFDTEREKRRGAIGLYRMFQRAKERYKAEYIDAGYIIGEKVFPMVHDMAQIKNSLGLPIRGHFGEEEYNEKTLGRNIPIEQYAKLVGAKKKHEDSDIYQFDTSKAVKASFGFVPSLAMPNVNSIGEKLSAKYGLVKGSKAYNQTLDNCASIAKEVAGAFGYAVPEEKLLDFVFEKRGERIFGGGLKQRTKGFLNVRQPESLGKAHVTFQHGNTEFNYGPSEEEGYQIIDRIPLDRLTSSGFIPNLNSTIGCYDDMPNLFTGNIRDALARENRATGGNAVLGQSAKLISSENPYGLAAIDKRSQGSADEAISQHMSIGQSMGEIKRAKTASTGFIPNLVTDTSSQIMFSAVLAALQGAQGFSEGSGDFFKDLKNSIGSLLPFFSKEARAKQEALSREQKEIQVQSEWLSAFEKTRNTLRETNGPIDFQTKHNDTRSVENFTSLIDFERKVKPQADAVAQTIGEFKKKLQEQTNTTRKAGFVIAGGAGVVGGFASTFASRSNAPDLSNSLDEITSGVQNAGQALAAFPGKFGKILAVFSAVDGIVNGIASFARGVEGARRNLELQQSNTQKFSASLQGVSTSLSNLNTMALDASVTMDALNREQRNYAEAIAQLRGQSPKGEELAGKIENAGTIEDKIRFIGDARREQERGLEKKAASFQIKELASDKVLGISGTRFQTSAFSGGIFAGGTKLDRERASSVVRGAASSVIPTLSDDEKFALGRAGKDDKQFEDVVNNLKDDTAKSIVATIREEGGNGSDVKLFFEQLKSFVNNELISKEPSVVKARASAIGNNAKSQLNLDNALRNETSLRRLFLNAGAIRSANVLDTSSFDFRTKQTGRNVQNETLKSQTGQIGLLSGDKTVAAHEFGIEINRIQDELEAKVVGIRDTGSRKINESFVQHVDSLAKPVIDSENAKLRGQNLGAISSENQNIIDALNKGLTAVNQNGGTAKFIQKNGGFDFKGFEQSLVGSSGATGETAKALQGFLASNRDGFEKLDAIRDVNVQIAEATQSASEQAKIQTAKLAELTKELDLKRALSFLGGADTLTDRGKRRQAERDIIRGGRLLDTGATPEIRAIGASQFLRGLKANGQELRIAGRDERGRAIGIEGDEVSQRIARAMNVEAFGNAVQKFESAQRIQNSLVSSGAGNAAAVTGNLFRNTDFLKTSSVQVANEHKAENDGLIVQAQKVGQALETNLNASLHDAEQAIRGFANELGNLKIRIGEASDNTKKAREDRDATTRRETKRVLLQQQKARLKQEGSKTQGEVDENQSGGAAGFLGNLAPLAKLAGESAIGIGIGSLFVSRQKKKELLGNFKESLSPIKKGVNAARRGLNSPFAGGKLGQNIFGSVPEEESEYTTNPVLSKERESVISQGQNRQDSIRKEISDLKNLKKTGKVNRADYEQKIKDKEEELKYVQITTEGKASYLAEKAKQPKTKAPEPPKNVPFKPSEDFLGASAALREKQTVAERQYYREGPIITPPPPKPVALLGYPGYPLIKPSEQIDKTRDLHLAREEERKNETLSRRLSKGGLRTIEARNIKKKIEFNPLKHPLPKPSFSVGKVLEDIQPIVTDDIQNELIEEAQSQSPKYAYEEKRRGKRDQSKSRQNKFRAKTRKSSNFGFAANPLGGLPINPSFLFSGLAGGIAENAIGDESGLSNLATQAAVYNLAPKIPSLLSGGASAALGGSAALSGGLIAGTAFAGLKTGNAVYESLNKKSFSGIDEGFSEANSKTYKLAVDQFKKGKSIDEVRKGILTQVNTDKETLNSRAFGSGRLGDAAEYFTGGKAGKAKDSIESNERLLASLDSLKASIDEQQKSEKSQDKLIAALEKLASGGNGEEKTTTPIKIEISLKDADKLPDIISQKVIRPLEQQLKALNNKVYNIEKKVGVEPAPAGV
jgi:TP901 family phage tail tape measure protein